jgi:hypothetical protein
MGQENRMLLIYMCCPSLGKKRKEQSTNVVNERTQIYKPNEKGKRKGEAKLEKIARTAKKKFILNAQK